MAVRAAVVIATLAWLALGASITLALCPWMITSGKAELILLGFTLPPAYLLLSLLAYITWADACWYGDSLPVDPDLDTPVCPVSIKGLPPCA